jgi:hypothetical protein
MTAQPRKPKVRFILYAGLVAAAAVMMPAGFGGAWSQTAPVAPSLDLREQPQPTTSRDDQSSRDNQPLAAAPGQDNSGLFRDIGKLFEKSLSVLPPLKSPSEAIDDLNARARETARETFRDAGDALSRLAKPSSMVTGRTICPAATNGPPDCKAAADRLCQSKGYKEGKSLNADSAETCSAKVYIPGRQRKPGDCRTDNYVTTALCQ